MLSNMQFYLIFVVVFFQFAAAQFSSNYRIVFNFNDFQTGSAVTNLLKERQMSTLTNTYRALHFVL